MTIFNHTLKDHTLIKLKKWLNIIDHTKKTVIFIYFCSSGTKEFVVDSNFAQAKGLKKKEGGHKSGSRLKIWHEKTTKRTKVLS